MFADLRLEIVGGKLKVTKLQCDVDGENLVIKNPAKTHRQTCGM